MDASKIKTKEKKSSAEVSDCELTLLNKSKPFSFLCARCHTRLASVTNRGAGTNESPRNRKGKMWQNEGLRHDE